jgi:hypothetical protein
MAWQIQGQYMETCNCTFLCPCGPSSLTATPTEGNCKAALALRIEKGEKDGVSLDGLSFIVVLHSPRAMAEGDMTVGLIVDDRASAQQVDAIAAIATGAAGGPMAAFAPMISTNLGAKKVPIRYQVNGKKRSVEIAGVMHLAVEPLPTMREDGQMWAATGHPVNPDWLGMAMGAEGNIFSDHGMSWDNSGRNAHYAPINWSGQQ